MSAAVPGDGGGRGSGQAGLWEREEEREAIAVALGAACRRDHRGSALFFRGEPGLGKTSLLSVATDAAAERFTVVRAGGHEMEQGYPFAVVHQVIESLLARYGADLEELNGGPGSLRALMQSSVQAAAGPERATPPARSEVVYAVYWFMASVAERQPLLLCLDDLHWSDPDSLEAFRFLVLRVEPLPVVLVGALRPWPALTAQVVDSVTRDGRARAWDLRPLTPAASLHLLAQGLGGPPSPDRAREAYALAGGNPFLVQELARIWRAGDSRPGGPSPEGDPPLSVPAGGGGSLVLARLAGLPRQSRRLLEAASVLGPEFRLDVALDLAQLRGKASVPALAPLESLGLVQHREGGRAAFHHPLLCRAVYEGIDPASRRALHRGAVGLLRSRGARASDLAPHLLLAASPGDAEAVRELRRAASDASALGAHDSAALHFRHAASLSPPGPERASILYELGRAHQLAGAQDLAGAAFSEAAADPGCEVELRCRVHRSWGFSLTLAGDIEAARERLKTGIDAAAGCNLALAAEIAVAAAVLEMTTSGMHRGMEAAQRALGLARASGDPAALSKAWAIWSNVAFNQGASQAYECGREALARLPPVEPDETELFWGWSGPIALGMITMRSERYGEAEGLLRRAWALAQARGSRYALIWASTFLTELAWRRGRLREAFRHSEDTTAYPVDVPWATCFAYGIRGRVLLEMGDLEGAEACLARSEEEGLRAHLAPGVLASRWGQAILEARRGLAERAADMLLAQGREAGGIGIADPSSFRWRQEAAEACVRCGRLDEAERLVRVIEVEARRLQRPGLLASAQRCRGMLRAVQGRDAEAGEAFSAALETYRNLDEALERARTLLAFGTWLRRTGEARRARLVLDEASTAFEACGSPLWQRQAESERRAAGGRRRARAHAGRLGCLTPQEYRVAELVSQGLSNRQIACQLLVSPNTLETHLRHVYAKLELPSRRELVAYFAAHPALPFPGAGPPRV